MQTQSNDKPGIAESTDSGPEFSARHWLELKLPPPVVALIIALMMTAAATLPSPIEIAFVWRLAGALFFVAIGLAFEVAAMHSFWRRRTTINPLRPTASSTLVVGGVYRYTRNPMYLGLFLDLVAWAVYLGNPWALLPLPLFVIYLQRFQIVPEERALAALFGEDYAAYQGRVRRWI